MNIAVKDISFLIKKDILREPKEPTEIKWKNKKGGSTDGVNL